MISFDHNAYETQTVPYAQLVQLESPVARGGAELFPRHNALRSFRTTVGAISGSGYGKPLAALESFRELTAGWDGPRSTEIPHAAINAAVAATRFFELRGYPAPHASPTADSGVQIEWDFADRALELEFTAEGTLLFLLIDPSAGLVNEAEIDPDNLSAMCELLDRAVRG